MVWEMAIVEEDSQISPQMVEQMVGSRDKHLYATIVVSLAISAHIVINHQDKEEICILCLHICLIGPMIMALRLEGTKQVLVD